MSMWLGNMGFFGCAPNPKDTTYRLNEFLSAAEAQCMQSSHRNIPTMQWNPTPPHKLQVCLPNFESDIKFIMTQYVALATINKLIFLATQQESTHTNLFDAVIAAHQMKLISDEQRTCLLGINRAGNTAKHCPLWTTSGSASRRAHSQPPQRQPYRE